jgi:hypothetical protein
MYLGIYMLYMYNNGPVPARVQTTAIQTTLIYNGLVPGTPRQRVYYVGVCMGLSVHTFDNNTPVLSISSLSHDHDHFTHICIVSLYTRIYTVMFYYINILVGCILYIRSDLV